VRNPACTTENCDLDLNQKRGSQISAKGAGPFAPYLKLSGDAPVPPFAEPEKIGVVVADGEKNVYWFATDFGQLMSPSIDLWR